MRNQRQLTRPVTGIVGPVAKLERCTGTGTEKITNIVGEELCR